MDYTSLSDETLLVLITRADADALGELFNRYQRLVFSLAFNIVGDRATAEEITLDVFTRVWEKAGAYQVQQAAVTTWLSSITRYRAIDILRRRAVRVDHRAEAWADISAKPVSPDDDPETATLQSLQRDQVRAAVAGLPPEQKEALALAYFKGYTHREIAEILNQPLGTIKTRIRLALKKLRQALEPEQEDKG
ncbi:MAG: sigma-70 family RNA polymerase sigma factor [Chloroflexi bacterium]|nr:MAG: sigma-70 family RNA polymerase sigma factor [Chloroflexota bacterium]